MTTAETSRRVLEGRYELHSLIAVGGMGEVWRARDVLLDRSVAVKLLRSEWAADPVFIARFRSEARHAASLSHPNIAAVLDYGESTSPDTGEQLAYLVMELVEGAPLSARLAAEGALDAGTTLSVLRQAAAGLAEAHRAGVVHRDVKPANILVRPDGTVKLTDFGISWSAGSVPLTRTGQVIGTAQYMSPEQAMGEPVSPASDVYALGMVGYESLTGHTAFEGDNPVTVALKQVQERPEPLPADLPPDVRALIDAALVKDPGERMPDGEAFLTAVEETLAHPSVTAPRTRPVARATPPRSAATAAGRSPAGSSTRRRALRVVLPLVATLSLGAGAAALLATDSPPEAAQAADPRPSAPPTTSATAAGVRLTADDYTGRPVEDVVADLTALGLTVRQLPDRTTDRPPGTVTRLEPAGALLAPGEEVVLLVAAPPAEVPAPPGPPVQADVVEPADPAPRPAPQAGPGAESAAPLPTTGPPTGAPDDGSAGTGAGAPAGALDEDAGTGPEEPGTLPQETADGPGSEPSEPSGPVGEDAGTDPEEPSGPVGEDAGTDPEEPSGPVDEDAGAESEEPSGPVGGSAGTGAPGAPPQQTTGTTPAQT